MAHKDPQHPKGGGAQDRRTLTTAQVAIDDQAVLVALCGPRCSKLWTMADWRHTGRSNLLSCYGFSNRPRRLCSVTS